MPIPDKVIQVVAWKDILIALTDTGQIWAVRGRGAGTDLVDVKWQPVHLETDPTPFTMW